MLVQQTIFTSIRSGRNEGYQIAVSSPGISAEESRELAQWGPGHDSVHGELLGTGSINFHRMESGTYCVSQTVLTGREYSGRGGQRVHTHMLLVPDELLRRFGNNPFRVVESLVVSGRFPVQLEVPTELEPLNLVGRASLVNTANLEHVVRKIGPQKLASLVTAALATESLGVSSNVSGKRLYSALLDLLPPSVRPAYSLTTGLKVSASRRYRLAILPDNAEERRRAIRTVRLAVLDLTNSPPAKFAPNRGWPQMVHQLLRAKRYATLANVIEVVAHSTEQDTDLLAEQQRERLEKDAEQAALTSLPA